MFNLVAMVNLKLVKSLKKKSFSLVLHVLKGGGRGDQVRVPDKEHIVVVVVVVVVVMVVMVVVVGLQCIYNDHDYLMILLMKKR